MRECPASLIPFMLYRNEFYSLRDIGYRAFVTYVEPGKGRSIGSGPCELERERVA